MYTLNRQTRLQRPIVWHRARSGKLLSCLLMLGVLAAVLLPNSSIAHPPSGDLGLLETPVDLRGHTGLHEGTVLEISTDLVGALTERTMTGLTRGNCLYESPIPVTYNQQENGTVTEQLLTLVNTEETDITLTGGTELTGNTIPATEIALVGAITVGLTGIIDCETLVGLYEGTIPATHTRLGDIYGAKNAGVEETFGLINTGETDVALVGGNCLYEDIIPATNTVQAEGTTAERILSLINTGEQDVMEDTGVYESPIPVAFTQQANGTASEEILTLVDTGKSDMNLTGDIVSATYTEPTGTIIPATNTVQAEGTTAERILSLINTGEQDVMEDTGVYESPIPVAYIQQANGAASEEILNLVVNTGEQDVTLAGGIGLYEDTVNVVFTELTGVIAPDTTLELKGATALEITEIKGAIISETTDMERITSLVYSHFVALSLQGTANVRRTILA